MNLNSTQLDKLSDAFQNLSNLAHQAASKNGAQSSTSADYFNQLLAQMSHNLQAGGTTSGSVPAGASNQQSSSNALTALLGKYI